MKTRRIKPLLFIVTAAMAIVLALGVLPATPLSASGPSRDIYPDRDYLLNNQTYKITDYPNFLSAAHPNVNANQLSFSLVLYEDDWIVKIISKELLASTNETLYSCKEYGFFIFIKPYGSNYQFTVMFFDINTNLHATTDKIIVSVNPIYEYTYAYLNKGLSSFNVQTYYHGDRNTKIEVFNDKTKQYTQNI